MRALLHRRETGFMSLASSSVEHDPPSPQKREKEQRDRALAAMHWQAAFNGLVVQPTFIHARQPSASKEARVHREHRMYETDPSFRPVRSIYMAPTLDDRSRATLVNWTIHLGTAIDCTSEIVHLGVALWDRYMTVAKEVNKPDLVAISCLCLAVQNELRTLAEAESAIQVLCYSGGYTLREVRHMMVRVQQILYNYLQTATTAITFSNLYLKVGHGDIITRRLVAFLSECMLADVDLQTRFLPSELAATTVLIARRTLHTKYVGAAWSVTLAQFSGYREDDLRKCVEHTERFMTAMRVMSAMRAGPLTAAAREYSTTRYHEASKIPLVFN